eukprot:scaffold7017_cov134-Cylindrotheca_fusiformis.AAC.6
MEVHLAIYDLSNGMARALSAQFLGPNHTLDMIPHTALLCFGKEYFFGGGIQAVDPHMFRSMRGIQPCQIERLGVTQISMAEFEAWCRNVGRLKFNAASYDLLHRNCNNFSHEAALEALKLPKGVPDWILHVPQRFLSSPMGQMIRPMLENMQITQTAPVQGGSTFSVMDPSSFSPPHATTVNPWADKEANNPAVAFGAASISSTSPPNPLSTESVLNKFSKPMISNDSQSTALCFKKLSQRLISDNPNLDEGTLAQLQQILKGHSCSLTPDLIAIMVKAIWRLLEEDTKAANTSFALLLLRLIVLKFPSECQECMEWLFQIMANEEDAWKTPMVRSLAWCVASNYLAVNNRIPKGTAATVDAAIGDWRHDTVQVRQAASTYLYNYALLKNQQTTNDEVADDSVVSMLCSAMENLTEERDGTTRLRQLVICGRLVFPKGSDVNEVEKELMQDLGFVGILLEIVDIDVSSSSPSSDATECHQLALELIYKFQN